MSPSHLLTRVDHWLARHLSPRPLALGPGPGVLSLSFDDAPASACREGRAILEQHGARGTWYLAGGLTDQLEQGERCHSVADARALAEAGHELGCHTFSHRPCSQLGPGGLAEEIRRNAEFFTRELGLPAPRHFSFPLGDYGLAAKRLAGAHFDSLRLTRPGLQCGVANLHALPAQALYADGFAPARLQALIEATAACGGWLILYTHGVSGQPGRWGCRPQQLAQALAWARQAGCEILPVGEAIAGFRARGGAPRLT